MVTDDHINGEVGMLTAPGQSIPSVLVSLGAPIESIQEVMQGSFPPSGDLPRTPTLAPLGSSAGHVVSVSGAWCHL